MLATILLDNGSVLRFVELEPGHVAVHEEAPAGARSIGVVTELPADAPLASVFHAFSLPGEPTPAALLAASPVAEEQPQGWARALVVGPASITTGNCNDANFRGWFDSMDYDDRGTPDIRLNQVPLTSPYFEHYDYAPGNGFSYDFYRYTVGGNLGSIWYDVDRYASRVAVCNLGTTEPGNPGGAAHPAVSYQGYSNTHMGPLVVILFRKPGETVWSLASGKDFNPADVGLTSSWHFYSAHNWDWLTNITWAGANDSFDIGHAVEDL